MSVPGCQFLHRGTLAIIFITRSDANIWKITEQLKNENETSNQILYKFLDGLISLYLGSIITHIVRENNMIH